MTTRVEHLRDGAAGTAAAGDAPLAVRFDDVVELLPDATFVLDVSGRVVAWNRACEALTGTGREAMIGQGDHAYAEPFFGARRPTFVDLLDASLPEVEASYAQLTRDADGIAAEIFLPRLRGGRGAHLWGRARALLDPQGRRCGIIAVIRDVTGHRELELALRQKEAELTRSGRELALILNNVSDVIFSVAVERGPEYRFAWVNQRFLDVTGLRKDQVVGVLCRDVIPPPAHSIVFPKYAEAARTGQPARWMEISEYPGGKKYGLVTVAPVVDAGGTCTQLVGMVYDITELKLAEEQIGRLNADLRREAEVLEERVRERTAQLAARNQELKDFAYTVSHDLKAPLRGIAGYANELDRKHRAGLDERAGFCLKQILTAASHLDQLIEDLLRYSRLDAETPAVTDVDLRELVGALLRDRELALAELHAEVTVELPAGRVPAWERGLRQVIANLVDNALKYSRASEPPRIRIAAEIHEGAWRLSVADNGIGFDLKYHDRIYKLFNRLVRMEDYEGTGAGLAIAKKVLDKQGGRIWAQAAPGEGATFFVELPLPPAAPQDGGRS